MKPSLHQEPDELLSALRVNLNGNDVAAIHSQYNTFRKHHPEEQDKYSESGKLDKGVMALSWYLDKKRGPLYNSLVASVNSEHDVTKLEGWVSEKRMLINFSEEEFKKHQESGRVIWREDPITKGVWEYQDTNDVQVRKTMKRGKELRSGNERLSTDEDTAGFEATFDNFLKDNGMGRASFVDQSDGVWGMEVFAKGSGKGNAVGRGLKGKGKGNKGEPKTSAPPFEALEDMTEDDQRDALHDKFRKLKVLANKVSGEVDEGRHIMKRSKYYTKVVDTEFVDFVKQLGSLERDCHMTVTAAKKVSVEKLKEKLQQGAAIIKDAQNMVKANMKISSAASTKGE